MSFENLDQVIEIIPDDKREAVQSFLTSFAESASVITEDKFANFLKDPVNHGIVEKNFKSFITNPNNDQIVEPILNYKINKARDKALETFKEKEMPKIIEAEIRKRFPQADPLQLENADLKADLEKFKAEIKRKDLVNYAIQLSLGKAFEGFDPSRYIGEDEEQTKQNLENVISQIEALKKAVSEERDNWWRERMGNIPQAGADNSNPAWMSKPFNQLSIGEKTKLFKENPDLYKQKEKEIN